MTVVPLPRNTTRQAEGMLYGDVSRVIHRVTGAVIIAFVLVHVVVQTIMHVPAFAALKAGTPWLLPLQNQPWIHALLYFSIAFHTLHGLKLLAMELGVRVDYRLSLLFISSASVLCALREVLRYAGV